MIIKKLCIPCTNCISEINNIQVDDAHDIDVIMHMYNLTDYSYSYSKISHELWQCYRDETKETGNNGAKDVEIMVPLKYLSNVWGTIEIPLINYEISRVLTWSKNVFSCWYCGK